jgi:hypothetical protein
MAKIPLPDRGQPLDVTYIYQVANAVNDIANQVSSATYNYTSIYTRDSGKQDTKTSETRVIGGYIDITNNETISTVGITKEKTFNFPTDFKYPPIVTATVTNFEGTVIGNDVSVVIKEVTTSAVTVIVKFNRTGQSTTSVNFIAIGIPN